MAHNPYHQYPSGPMPAALEDNRGEGGSHRLEQSKPWYKKWGARIGIALACVLALAVLLAIMAAMYGSNLEEEQRQAAVEKCEEKVTEHAKYPGGVTFLEPSYPATVQYDYVTDGGNRRTTYKQNGEVDFLSGFGVPVRHNYECVVDVGPGMSAYATDVEVYEDSLEGVLKHLERQGNTRSL